MATNQNMIKIFLSLLLVSFVFSSCFSKPALMTYTEFDAIQMGTPIAELRSEIGKPYAIHHKEADTEEYEYVERIDAGNSLFAENHYFLIVNEGKIIGKYMTRASPPAYDLIYQEEPNYPNP